LGRQTILQLARQHDDLAPMMAFVRDEIRKDVSNMIPAKPLTDVTSVLGMRRQPLGGGTVFRAGITPRYVIRGEDDVRRGLSNGVGLSVGLAF
jgi:hypothetical protein